MTDFPKILITNNQIKNRYYIFKFLSSGEFYTPIWYFYLVEQCGIAKELSFSIWSLIFIAMLLFELPSGAWADRFSRKNVIAISIVLKSLAFILLLLKPGIVVIAIAIFLIGISSAFLSGTIEALVYDNLSLNGESETSGLFENGNMVFFIGRSLSVLIGAWFYHYSIYAPFWISLFFCVLFLVVLLATPELAYKKSESKDNLQQIKQALSLIYKNRQLRFWIFTIFVLFLLNEWVWFDYQPYADLMSWSKNDVGTMFFVNGLVSGIGAYLFKYIKNDKLILNYYLPTAFFISSVSMFLLTFMNLWITYISIALISLVWGSSYPAFIRLVNPILSSEYRATCLSFIGWLEILVCVVSLIPLGYLNASFGILILFKVFSLLSAICFVASFLYTLKLRFSQ
jgi:MFS family permease